MFTFYLLKRNCDTVTLILLDLFAPNIEKNKPSGKGTFYRTEKGTQVKYSVLHHKDQIKPHFVQKMQIIILVELKNRTWNFSH